MHITVIFDGVCNLCNSTVDFLLRHDHHHRMIFGSFQTERAQELLREHGVYEAPETIYVIADGRLYSESDAVLRIARELPIPWRLTTWFRYVPRALRNVFYRCIARNRYRWFGKRSSCRLPTAEERSRFM
ncbi:MAG TPA: thiol-disulfide oxidoreductase DCC [Bacteroidetes bacterium]|nr:thiol-disulfide oxidoreductase DCC [Bacteroidota bacterium]HRK05212.1 thiol-disulfide oxidoreductase DCC family protein [Chlorobiota bacterium]